MEPRHLLDSGGRLQEAKDWPLEVTADLCSDLYRKMKIARSFDDAALALQRQGELGLWLQSLGQEAAQVGSITALRPTDHVFPSYREHAAALCRGIGPAQLMSQWRGATHSGWDPTEYRFHIYTLVLAAQLSHATGYAMGVQRDGSDEIVACYFGDGAASEGEANEALNWAAAGNAPVLFFCQNNHWAISTPVSIQMKSPMHERARGFGLEAHVVDGNDVLGVHAAVTAAAARVRSGAGPVLVEAVTYRMAGHSTSDDPKRYRTQEELEAWAARDPIARLEAFMEREGWLVDELVFEIKEACDEIAAVAREACRAIRPGSLEELFENVLAEPTSLLASERREYAELEASYVD